jgi:RNA polymerase sigma factor (sigma-70 family)
VSGSFLLLYRLLEWLLSNLKGAKKLKINYKFANETVEIEVSEDWGNILIDLDRQEYNVNHRETRRHTTLNSENEDGEWLAVEDAEIDALFTEEGGAEKLHSAISQLSPKQQKLVQAIYFDGISVNDYATGEGVDQSAISHRLQTIYKKIKKFL